MPHHFKIAEAGSTPGDRQKMYVEKPERYGLYWPQIKK